jgi:hypothetical protein
MGKDKKSPYPRDLQGLPPKFLAAEFHNAV